jgi:hypothetical protein
MKKLVLSLLVGCCVLFLDAASFSQAAKSEDVLTSRYLSYEGVLTDASGEKMSGEQTIVFRLYDSLESQENLWEETHRVTVNDGEFKVTLGKKSRLPKSDEGSFYIGITINEDELMPRQALAIMTRDDAMADYSALQDDAATVTPPVAVPFGAGNGGGWTDDGAVVRLTTSSDKVGVGTTSPEAKLHVDGSTTALKGEGSSAISAVNGIGVFGVGKNTSPGIAYGGYFTTINEGTGTHYGTYSRGNNASSGTAYGAYGYASNTSDGAAFGGFFDAASDGSGSHYGVYGRAQANSSNPTKGVRGYALNSGSGDVIGGDFQASSSGTGTHYGIHAESVASSSSTAYGTHSTAQNSGDGVAYGGFFDAASDGSGLHYGVYGRAQANSSSLTKGVRGYALNSGSGDVRGGDFHATSSGTGTHYGVYAESYGSSSNPAYGAYCRAENTSSGSSYGGRFLTSSSGSGTHYGIRASGYGSSSSVTYGVYGYGDNTSSGEVYGGYFQTTSNGTGNHFGLRAVANGSATNYGGFFWAGNGAYNYGIFVQSGVGYFAEDVSCAVLEIRGGSDIAEPFDIKGTDEIEEGMVVVIDAQNPGKLKLSEKAYDRCVAGIISGAGSINPGMVMGQTGTEADGEHPVALTGRVYCMVDASNGAIQPGDLLTTADTPGHAMKVTDHQLAQGAILGKAMSALESGQGLVLTLVTLQ